MSTNQNDTVKGSSRGYNKREYQRQYQKENHDRLLIKKRRDKGVCALCNTFGTLYRDHDHASGLIRGFICRNCNFGLGFLKDNVEVTRRAAEYLERFQTSITNDPRGFLAARVDEVLANLGATSELHTVQRNGGPRGSVRPSMLDRSRRTYNLPVIESTLDRPQRAGEINRSTGYSDQEFNNPPSGWTSQADGFNGEDDSPGCPPGFDGEAPRDNSG